MKFNNLVERAICADKRKMLIFLLLLEILLFAPPSLSGKKKSKDELETVIVSSVSGDIRFTFPLSDSNIDNRTASFCKKRGIVSCKRIFDDAMRIIYSKSPPYLTPTFVIEKYKSFAGYFNKTKFNNRKTVIEVGIDGSSVLEGIPISILDSNRNVYNKKDLSKIRILLLISHYKEDLSWLEDIHQDFSYIIASKTVRSKTIFVKKNKGNEVSSYLTYLVKYYNRFPEYTLFLHGHNEAWHQIYSVKFILDNLRITNPYQNINSVSLDKTWRERHMDGLRNVWNDIFIDELGNMPEELHDRCCGQFIVHRDRITARSKLFYEDTLHYVMNRDGMDPDGYHGSMSFYMEYIWHYVFGEAAVIDGNYNDLSGMRIDTVGVLGKMRYFL